MNNWLYTYLQFQELLQPMFLIWKSPFCINLRATHCIQSFTKAHLRCTFKSEQKKLFKRKVYVSPLVHFLKRLHELDLNHLISNNLTLKTNYSKILSVESLFLRYSKTFANTEHLKGSYKRVLLKKEMLFKYEISFLLWNLILINVRII